jgi:hypothetical protein
MAGIMYLLAIIRQLVPTCNCREIKVTVTLIHWIPAQGPLLSGIKSPYLNVSHKNQHPAAVPHRIDLILDGIPWENR